jgi:Ni,Fe-hydrogenase I cytochrome b subunit
MVENMTMKPFNANSGLRAYPVWDRTVRWFHWINVVCVLGLLAVGTFIYFGDAFGVNGEGKVLLKTIHVSIGYVFGVNLIWRLVWAFIGGPFARWGRLLPFGRGWGRGYRAYVSGFRRGDPPAYAGHNPAARVSVSLLLALMISQASTGLVLAGTDLYFPPFGASIAGWVAEAGQDASALLPGSKEGVDPAAWDEMRAFRSPFITVHMWGYYLLLGLVPLHVLGVIITDIRERSGLISAMFTGRKVFRGRPVDLDDDA